MVCLHEGEHRLGAEVPLGHYVDAVRSTDVSFWLDMYWGSWQEGGNPEEDLRIAGRLLDQGLNGGVFYYMSSFPTDWEGIFRRMKAL